MKTIESLQLAMFLYSQYLCNPLLQTFDVLTYERIKVWNIKSLQHQVEKIKEFDANTVTFTLCKQHWSAEPAAETTAKVIAKSEIAANMFLANLKPWLKFQALEESEVNSSKYVEPIRTWFINNNVY